jgi:predicted DNA-binding WGR domain protein
MAITLLWKQVSPKPGTSKARERELEDALHAALGPTWHAVHRDLRVLAWRDNAWRVLVNQKQAEAACAQGEMVQAVAVTPAGLVAVTERGSVLTFAGKSWTVNASRPRGFQERFAFVVGYDEATGRLVVWGGEVRERPSNDTLFFDGKGWTPAARSSPKPKDMKSRDSGWGPAHALVYDQALGRLVRFGNAALAVLEAEVWQPLAPKGYRELVRPVAWQNPVHDQVTGETLLVDLVAQHVVRFDLVECAEVATVEFPKEIIAQAEDAHPDYGESLAYSYLYNSLVYIAETRTLLAANKDNAAECYALDLAPAFATAQGLRPRTLRPKLDKGEAASVTRRLYRLDQTPMFWFCTVSGKTVSCEWGRLGDKGETKKQTLGSAAEVSSTAEKLIAAKIKEQYVEAAGLGMAALESIATRPVSGLSVGGKAKSVPSGASRLGGLPSGVPAAKWPRYDGEPMGFLFQLATGSLLAKHAGVAVFCALDGSAIEDEDGKDGASHVVLLTADDLAAAPPASAPPGVPPLAPRLITVEPPKAEIDEAVAQELVERDPAMSALVDRLRAKTKKPASSRLGGAPIWLQDDATPRGYRFVAQLDVEAISLGEAWEGAGLTGAVYVFVSSDEKKAVALWQAT